MGRRRTEGGDGEKVQKYFSKNISDEFDKRCLEMLPTHVSELE